MANSAPTPALAEQDAGVEAQSGLAPVVSETVASDSGVTEAETHTEVDAGHTEHVEPVAFGFVGPGAWVSLAMITFIGILLWKGVPKLITGGLDGKIAGIRQQLDEAKALRAEAEALRQEYADKIAGAEQDAASMIESAKTEAVAIVEKAEADTTALIARREQMAKDKIGAAERQAIDDLRATAANASTAAAASLIANEHDAEADSKLADEAIAAL